MRVLVTGGTGYLGSTICRVLTARGHQAVPFSRTSGGDVRDRAALSAAARHVDAIIHSAALVSIWRRRAMDFDDINVGGLENVLSVAREHGLEFLPVDPDVSMECNEDTVYVLMIEEERVLGRWIKAQRDESGANSMRPDQFVLVTSCRFRALHSELNRWLVIEFDERGKDPQLTPSGTASGLSLASQIMNAISMKLVGLLAKRRCISAAGNTDLPSNAASPRPPAMTSPVRP